MKTFEVRINDENYDQLIWVSENLAKTNIQNFVEYLVDEYMKKPVTKKSVLSMRRRIEKKRETPTI